MLISKVNVYTANAKAYQTKAQTFKGKLPEPKKCFEMSNNEFFYKYGAYKGIITYNQILSLKNLAEKYQIPFGQYALHIISNVPVCACFGRLDVRQSNMAYYSLSGYSF